MTGPLLLPVLPSKHLRAWPKHDKGSPLGYQLAPIALRARYATDAHTAGYSAPNVPRRLDKGAAEQIPGGVAMVALFVDVDGAEHKADPAWRAAESSKIAAALAALPGGFCYQTRGGYRLVWRLAAPVLIAGPDDAARWRLRYWRTLLALSRRFGLEGDPACADWTRLYRLPHATRDEGGQPEALPTEGDPELRQPLALAIEAADLAADLAEARRLEAAHPGEKDERGKTTTAAPWGAAVKALALEAGEREPGGTKSRPADEPASRPKVSRSTRLTREDRERLWAEKALEREAAKLAATRGGRNNAACKAAFTLGHYAPHLLDPSAIERALLAACERNGLVRDDGRDAALTTIRSAISDGAKTPKRPNVSDDRTRDPEAWKEVFGKARSAQQPPTDEGAPMPDHDHDQADEGQGPASGPQPANSNNLEARPAVLVDFETGQRIREAEAALAARDDLNLYVRDGRLVSVQTSTSKRKRTMRDDAGAPLARDLALPALRALLTDVVVFEHLVPKKGEDGKIERGEDKKPIMVRARCRPHDDIVKGLHSAPEWPELRDLVGIVRAPFLASLEGETVTRPGYHEESGYLLVAPQDFERIEVPEQPSREQAAAALETIKDVFCDFPFAGERDRSAALAALLSVVARPALGGENIPGFVFEANTPAAGKTKLADTIATIATGAKSPKQGFTRDESEMEKLLGSLAGEARALLTFDNITETIGGSKLDLVLTCNGSFSYRLLGQNRTVQSAWRTVLFFTGNNPTISGDIGRRLLVCRLDCQADKPNRREGFKHQLPKYAHDNRASLVGCALTVLRAFCQLPAAQRPKVRSIGSFEKWSQLVAGALLWLGEADPLESVAEERDEGADPAQMAHVALLEHWNRLETHTRSALRWGPDGLAVRVAIEALYPQGTAGAGDDMDDLREALEVLAPPSPGRPPSVARLGYALRHLRDRPANGRKLVGKPDRNGVMAWRVVVKNDNDEQSKKTSPSAGDAGDAGDKSSQSQYPARSQEPNEKEEINQDARTHSPPRTEGKDPPQSPASPAPMAHERTPLSELIRTLREAPYVSLAFQYAQAEAERRLHPRSPRRLPPGADRDALEAAYNEARARSERDRGPTPTPPPASGVKPSANDPQAPPADVAAGDEGESEGYL